jgi:hypothetical protein
MTSDSKDYCSLLDKLYKKNSTFSCMFLDTCTSRALSKTSVVIPSAAIITKLGKIKTIKKKRMELFKYVLRIGQKTYDSIKKGEGMVWGFIPNTYYNITKEKKKIFLNDVEVEIIDTIGDKYKQYILKCKKELTPKVKKETTPPTPKKTTSGGGKYKSICGGGSCGGYGGSDDYIDTYGNNDNDSEYENIYTDDFRGGKSTKRKKYTYKSIIGSSNKKSKKKKYNPIKSNKTSVFKFNI